MSSVQGQRRSMHSRSRSVPQGISRRSSDYFAGLMPLGLRAAGFIGRGPKELWPYVLPWVFALLTISFFCLVVRGVLTRQLLVPPVEVPQSLVTRGYTSPDKRLQTAQTTRGNVETNAASMA
ncbi:hypothetical protein LMG27174_06024 [Paraburkholderia rhynchosiae]|uniref:Uncharacterized protein n=1 Tax=Paraburkholderia rhynchosiae TaxID=487049 RepID=A0A6J5CGQ0_9BURK|nr:hypothetical protein LMG27174_06024 [Paraburkholderia rhynchosiae]